MLSVRRHKFAGFSLLEVMIVVGILAAVMAVGLPRMRKPSINVRDVMRTLQLTIKETRAHARLKHLYYRIVIAMNGEEQNYFIESGSTADKFEADQSVLKKPRTLPDKLFLRASTRKVWNK